MGPVRLDNEILGGVVGCECGQPLYIPKDAELTEVEGWRSCWSGIAWTNTRTIHKAKLYTHELDYENH
jgi:hypothetical protein